jgi:hypothetical protein
MEDKKNIHLVVPTYLHKEIRVAAALEGVSIMGYCLRAVLEQMVSQKKSKIEPVMDELTLEQWLDKMD